MSSFNERLRNLFIIFAIVLATPLIIFLISAFKINPFAAPIIGTWGGLIYYNDSSNSISSQVNAVFTFTSSGNCSINMTRVYLAGDSNATQNIDKDARWYTTDGKYYLVYDNDIMLLDVETYSDITGSATRLYLQNETIGGTSSPFQGFLVQHS